jgi:hypothetical protein
MTVRRLAGASFSALAAALFISSSADAAVVISSKATKNMTCANGVCTPTKAKAVLNVTDLANMLSSGDVKVVSDSKALDIDFAASLSWTSTSRLTLDSYQSIIFEKPVTVAGTGALTITANGSGNGGDFWFVSKGHVEFWDLHSSLVINGNSYMLVKSIKQLAKAVAANPSGFYALAKSYNAGKDGTYSQSPISTALLGMFEGLGNQLTQFSMNLTEGSQYQGLFTIIRSGAIVRDLAMSDVRILAAQAPYAEVMGALTGLNYGSLLGDSVSGTVQGNDNAFQVDVAGGLVGENDGTIVACSSSATVTNASRSGGLVGVLNSTQGDGIAVIVRSSSRGTVTGRGAAGGLVGLAWGGGYEPISQAFASGAVSNPAGGATGGLVGENLTATIANSYSLGSVTTIQGGGAGGVVGYNQAKIATSYSTGAVSTGNCACGGFIGDDESDAGNLADNDWDLDTSGYNDPSKGAGNIANDPGITGLMDTQLKSVLPAGFDPAVWGQDPNINNGYPYLLANPPPK